ncbi:MAG: GNAT family N-acetyltransferase [Candidatus Margulisbacteria bacterium]|nr:GNAT family N-acetyltransferase [Candidatus Margulisiibacteriota bacterium]
MTTIRLATDKDNPQILKISKDLNLYYPTLSLTDFWVAEKGQKIIGMAQLATYGKIAFLSSVGVVKTEQSHGIAKELISKALATTDKDTYLYTVIPDFFKKFGFETTQEKPADLPSKGRYICEECFSYKCVTMIKHAA